MPTIPERPAYSTNEHRRSEAMRIARKKRFTVRSHDNDFLPYREDFTIDRR